MRKFVLPFVVLGFLIVGFAYILPVNKYGFEGSLDCDGPLRSIILMSLGIGFTLIGVFIFSLKSMWSWRNNKIFYTVLLLTAFVVVIKIPEIYRENQFNEQCDN